MLNLKFSRPQLKAQAATLPPRRPPTRDWLRRNPLKRQKSPDREKAKPAPHSSMRASSRGTRDDDSVISGGGSPAPPLFFGWLAVFALGVSFHTVRKRPPTEAALL